MNTYRGKIRLFLHKTDEDDFEEMDREYFEDVLISDIDERSCNSIIGYELENVGLYSIEDQLKEDVLSKYQIYDYVEVLTDFHYEGWVDHTYYGDEYESNAWLENIQHRKLNKYQTISFCCLPEEGCGE